ncbi:4-hydroxy-tetrahydrodipicolinate reductase [Alicyclobacillus sp. ALC3]|nr:4-hydroxy-tetrahydrodipicolinate reductase [Alicyclobacillus sp. ALC3]
MVPIQVVVAGANGKMGQEAVQAISADSRFAIAALLVRGRGFATTGYSAAVFDSAERLLAETRPDVWLDLTDARSVVTHVDLALEAGVRPVVGATGYQPADLRRWQAVCERDKLGGIAAPNFAIGALLMTRFAAEAARFYPNAEIIELHHDGKRDAPSGTAIRTARAMGDAREVSAVGDQAATLWPSLDGPDRGQAATAELPSARGQHVQGVAIHSIRLPGLVAHQEVLFGGTGEVLTIRHDSLSRVSFMPGVLFSLAKVMELSQFVYGLEHLLW